MIRAAAVIAAILLAPVAAAEDALPMTEVAAGVFVFDGHDETMSKANRGAIANVGFIVGADTVAVVDTGGSVAGGRALLAAIRQVTDRPVGFVINTHMHPDHVFGNAAFRGSGEGGTDPQFVGHSKLPRGLASRASHYLAANRLLLGDALTDEIEIILPTTLVETTQTLNLGERPLALRAWPTAHTDNDLTVFDEVTGTLFTGDLLFVRHTPALDGSLVGWLNAHAALADIPAARAVPGHGPPSVPWPDALMPQRRYLQSLAQYLRTAIAQGRPMAQTVESVPQPSGAWVLVDEYHKRNATAGFAELEWE